MDVKLFGKMENDKRIFSFTQDDLKQFLRFLPLVIIILIITTVASVISYYSVFDLHPLNYFTLIDFLPYFSNNLSTIAKSACGAYFMFALFLIGNYLFKQAQLSLYFLLLSILNITYGLYSFYFNTESTMLFLIFSRCLVISAMYTLMILHLFKANIKLIPWSNFIFRMLIVMLLLYFPIDYYLKAYSLMSNKLERITMLITNDGIIKPFSDDRYIIGSNNKYYFCYYSKTGSTQFIDHKGVIAAYEFPICAN